jgi:hypothetical protein
MSCKALAGYCEHGNGLSASINGGEALDSPYRSCIDIKAMLMLYCNLLKAFISFLPLLTAWFYILLCWIEKVQSGTLSRDITWTGHGNHTQFAAVWLVLICSTTFVGVKKKIKFCLIKRNWPWYLVKSLTRNHLLYVPCVFDITLILSLSWREG